MIDQFLQRNYSPAHYNCAHFALEVTRAITGLDHSSTLNGFLCAPSARKADARALRRVRMLRAPRNACFVYMQRRGAAHVGVWWKGKVLHLLENSRVQYVPLDVAAAGFTRVRFFECT